jgi:hypothetical protein
MTPGPATPATGPSAITPGAQPGVEAQALLKVRQASMLLAEAVGMLKSRMSTDLGKAVLSALKMLAPQTPGIEEGLGQSELASMLQGLQPVRNAPPQAGAPPWLGTRQPRPNVVAGPPMGGTAPPIGPR